MIPFQQALDTVLASAKILGTEQVPLQAALGRILAQELRADTDIPAFDKSAMDGYAVRMADGAIDLEVVEVVAAGSVPTKAIGPGQCAKIMTGAMLPSGADAVWMVEDTVLTADGKVRYTGKAVPNVCDTSTFNPNIRFRGEDTRAGDLVLSSGLYLRPHHLAALAGVGIDRPWVYRQPRIGVITTGSELVEPDQKPAQGQIRNTNGPQVLAQVSQMGLEARYYGIAPDTAEQTLALVQQASQENDVLMLTGGVSMGDFDFVPTVLRQVGFDLLFEQVAVQPGKPTVFGQQAAKWCFGLPGNPVSAYMQFELMVKPFLLALMGSANTTLVVPIPLGEALSRSKANRMAWIPVEVRNGLVFPCRYNGSGHINALAMADGLVAFELGQSQLEKGQLVQVHWLRP